jgi:hypothetical protein
VIRKAGPVAVVAGQRIWQATAGLVTAILLVQCLTPEQQGWYYGFTSAAALFALFDSGLSLILVQRSAALRAGLQLSVHGAPRGDLAPRFAALAGDARRWYGAAAGLFVATLTPGGLVFFASASAPDAVPAWEALWVALVSATAVNLWLLPFMSLVEGSGEIGAIYGLRLAQGVLGATACWLFLWTGAGAWACLAVPAGAAALGTLWLLLRKPALATLKGQRAGSDWRRDIWPQQWRLAISWTSGYLLTQIYTPLLLTVEGPTTAGQMGLSLAIANILALVSQSWLTQAYPDMALHAASRDWRTMMAVFRRAMWLSAVGYIAGALAVIALCVLAADTPYAARVLPSPAFAVLLGAIFLNQLCAGLAAQMRSAGREPFVWVSASGALLTGAGAIFVLQPFGVGGLVSVMLGVQLFFVFPQYLRVWISCRKALETL